MERESRCLLVLDANILIKDFWWKSETLEYLQNRMFLFHSIAIPKLSLDEATAHLIRRAENLKERMDENSSSERLIGQYQQLYNKSSKDAETPQELGKRYKQFITVMVQKFDGLIVENSKVDIDTILDRSINRIKPFNKGDKGFRDTILWLSILDMIKDYQRVSFISANVNDFANGSNDTLHKDLLEEVKEVLPSHLNFYFFRNLEAFIARMDPDRKVGAQAFLKAVMSGGYTKFKIDDWLEKNLIQKLSDSILEDFDGVKWAGLPYWVEAPKLIEIEDLVGIEIYRENFIEKNIIEFYVDIALIGIFICCIPSNEWEGVAFHRQIRDVYCSNFWTNIKLRSIGTFVIRLTFDIQSQQVLSFDGVPLEHDFDQAYEKIEDILLYKYD
ncbi:PIN domain-containing protein [Psychrobacter sp. I-STPA10]|uniref:PIN domain-containing protein n=1 Tax=Psychrobacter sp. I-STPA10 TaxID=2585769 RepID=UPI001E4B1C68|nr:PIN domain-containing protein [Psychrobacter sp. I-STPA10]